MTENQRKKIYIPYYSIIKTFLLRLQLGIHMHIVDNANQIRKKPTKSPTRKQT